MSQTLCRSLGESYQQSLGCRSRLEHRSDLRFQGYRLDHLKYRLGRRCRRHRLGRLRLLSRLTHLELSQDLCLS